jgi:hypothetical protein
MFIHNYRVHSDVMTGLYSMEHLNPVGYGASPLNIYHLLLLLNYNSVSLGYNLCVSSTLQAPHPQVRIRHIAAATIKYRYT